MQNIDFANINQYVNILNLEGEIWKPIKDYEGYYEISNYGRCKILEIVIIRKNGRKHHKKEKIFKNILGNRGYYRVLLRKICTAKVVTIHRVVAETFIPNAFPKHRRQVNHIDGNKLNNYIGNLEWVNAAENHYHALKKELTKVGTNFYSGERNGRTKLKTEEAKEIRLNPNNLSMKELAIKFNIHISTARRINKKLIWKYLTV
jgi:hypothetical protein